MSEISYLVLQSFIWVFKAPCRKHKSHCFEFKEMYLLSMQTVYSGFMVILMKHLKKTQRLLQSWKSTGRPDYQNKQHVFDSFYIFKSVLLCLTLHIAESSEAPASSSDLILNWIDKHRKKQSDPVSCAPLMLLLLGAPLKTGSETRTLNNY